VIREDLGRQWCVATTQTDVVHACD